MKPLLPDCALTLLKVAFFLSMELTKSAKINWRKATACEKGPRTPVEHARRRRGKCALHAHA